MEENTFASFASFTPITAFDGQDTEELKRYYMENNLTPENDNLKKYLNWPDETIVPSSIVTPNTNSADKFDVGKLLGGISYSSPKSNKSSKSGTVSSGPTPKNPKEFLEKYGASAKKAAEETGISEDLLLTQVALETGWGKHTPGNNVGGVKPGKSWTGKTQTLTTKEFENGKYVTKPQVFRAYDSPEEGFQGYVDFLTSNKRYQNLKGVTDPLKAIALMGKSGYATSPEYTVTLQNVMKQIQSAKS